MMILLSMLLLLLPPLLSCICYHHNRSAFSGRVAQHGDHVSRKRVLLGARSVSSDVVIEELKKTPAQFLHGIYPQGKQQRTPPKAWPTQRLVSNLPSGVTISAQAIAERPPARACDKSCCNISVCNTVEVSAQYTTGVLPAASLASWPSCIQIAFMLRCAQLIVVRLSASSASARHSRPRQ